MPTVSNRRWKSTCLTLLLELAYLSLHLFKRTNSQSENEWTISIASLLTFRSTFKFTILACGIRCKIGWLTFMRKTLRFILFLKWRTSFKVVLSESSHQDLPRSLCCSFDQWFGFTRLTDHSLVYSVHLSDPSSRGQRGNLDSLQSRKLDWLLANESATNGREQ